MTLEQLKQLITDLGYKNVSVLEEYADAFIGMSNDGRAVYSYDKMIEWFMLKYGLTLEKAIEWIEADNTIQNLTDHDPIIVYDVPEHMMIDYDKERDGVEDENKSD